MGQEVDTPRWDCRDTAVRPQQRLYLTGGCGARARLNNVPGKHYTTGRQPADTLTAAAVDGSGNVPNNGVASTTTAAAALALVF